MIVATLATTMTVIVEVAVVVATTTEAAETMTGTDTMTGTVTAATDEIGTTTGDTKGSFLSLASEVDLLVWKPCQSREK